MIAEEATGGERRKSDRVTFERGVDVYLMAIDGTWRRDCIMQDAPTAARDFSSAGRSKGLT